MEARLRGRTSATSLCWSTGTWSRRNAAVRRFRSRRQRGLTAAYGFVTWKSARRRRRSDPSRMKARPCSPLATGSQSGCKVAQATAPRTSSSPAHPRELVEGRSLRAELTRGGPAAFATVEFLRRVTGYAKSVPPPPRACFLFDDPNLHSGRYGFLDYRQLGAHAQDHGYHVAMAMVPLDAWFARRDAARLFRERSEYMSLVMHGNDHMPDELCCGTGRASAAARSGAPSDRAPGGAGRCARWTHHGSASRSLE